MTFHICGQCDFFERESHPDDDEQNGVCVGWEPAILVVEGDIQMAERSVDAGRRACAIFREAKR